MPKVPSQTPKKEIPATEAPASHARWSLGVRVTFRLCFVLIAAAAILFIPARTLRFWQAWAFLALAFIPTAATYFYFLRRDPQLVERRLQTREQDPNQRFLMRWSKPFFFVVFLLPGFDHRLGWSRTLLEGVPLWLTLVSEALVLGNLLFVGWVMKVNSFAAHAVQVEAGQRVISIGPYCLVRHPLYSGSLMAWLFTPLALGSYVALPAFALLIPFYISRLLNEEKVLRKQLPGYTAYCHRTPFRLIPFVW
jgi:protein-S-isoprenylcysteine O-methyltransferase Ste14